MPAADLAELSTITEIAFVRAPMGASSVMISHLKVALGEAASDELVREFAANLLAETSLKVIFSGTRFTAADNGEGRVIIAFNEPYEYDGGDLLIDLSYSDIEGSMYTMAWGPGSSRLMYSHGLRTDRGNTSPLVPIIVVTGE